MSVAQNDLHIDAPELLSGRQRVRDKLVTAILWIAYLYLWVPLVSLFAWLLGIEIAYDVMIRSGGARELGGVLAFFGMILAIIFATVAIWSLGNRLRYGKMRRRHVQADASVSELAEFFAVEPDAVRALRESRSASIVFDERGNPRLAQDRTPDQP